MQSNQAGDGAAAVWAVGQAAVQRQHPQQAIFSVY
jgi:hypothetical protein